jgi:hypothetical protein
MIRFHTSSQAASPVAPGYHDDIDASMGVALQEAHALLDHHPSADPHALLCHMDTALRSQLHEHAQHGGSIAVDNTWLHQQLVTLATGQGFPNLDRLALLPIYLRFRLMGCGISGHYADSLGKGGGTLVIGNEPISGSIHQGVARTLPADSKPLLAATWALVAQVMTISTSPQASIEEVQALGDRSQLVYEAWLAYALQASNIEPNRVLLRQIVNRFDTPRAIEAGKDAKAALYPRLAHEGYWLLAFANFIGLRESILERFEEGNYLTDPDIR